MIRSAAPAATASDSYTLSSATHQPPKLSVVSGIRKLLPVMEGERSIVLQALIAVIVTSTSGLIGPMIIGRTIDVYIRNRDFQGVLHSALI